WQKLFGQVLAVFVLIKSGVRIQIVVFPDWLDLLLTVIWMLGIINAFNLVDIMDGLSASIGLVGATLLSAVAILNGDTTIAFLGVALAGSLVGFLRYNFHPAKIYMGDAGALFLGLMLGALAMIGEYSTNHPVSVLTPVFILGVPIFDMVFVMYIRWLRGLPVFLGSPDHVPLRLRHWGMTVPQVVILSAIATGVIGSIGLALMVVTSETAWMMVGATLVGGGVLVLLLRRVDVSAPGTGALEQAAVSEGQGGKSRV
ncbi:MAG: MraY family glycosyltransferase, partial [Nitrospirales bacterium]